MKESRGVEKREGQRLSRRGFLQGAVAAGIAATGATMLGCSPQQSATESMSKEEEAALAFAAEAEPIAPVEPPASWDVETDVVVVGSGAGGMVGALRLRELGYNVTLLEKDDIIGGASRYSGYFVNLGGHKMANEAQWAWPSYPYDPDNIVEYLNDMWQMSADVPLLKAQVVEGPKCIDWMADYLGVPWAAGFGSTGSLYFEGQTTKMNTIMINDYTFKFLTDLAEKAGVDIRMSTAATALVKEGDAVVGLKAALDGKDMFLRCSKGVLLTAGGFEMNRAMLKKYLPGSYEGLANVPCPPCNTGECIRMGLGVGADMSGLDSAHLYDGGVEWYEYDEYDTRMGAHVNKDGNQAVRQPWLRINRMGQRVPWLATFGQNYPFQNLSTSGFITGLTDGGAVEASQPGGRVYVCFDSKYDKLLSENYFKEGVCRPAKIIPEDDPLIDRVPEFQRDWHTGFQMMLDAGAVKKCDTIEELEQQLGLREGVLVGEVKKWNAACEAGEDYMENYKYDPSWLIPINEPPYYGAKVGGDIFTTKCGLRVTPTMQVVDTTGAVIKGLYAGWHTAGGANGEMNIAGKPQGGLYGDVGQSFVGGYMAANGIAADDGKTM